MTLSELFTRNYEYLNTVAKRIARRRDSRLANELLSVTYIEAHNRIERGKHVPFDNDEFVKWFCKCMKNGFVWPNSEFNSGRDLDINQQERHNSDQMIRDKEKSGRRIEYQSKSEDNFKGEIDTNPHGIEGIIDEDAQREIEIGVEQANDFTKELIEISSCLGKIKTLKYIELVEFKRTLPKHEEVLFELYFEKELSTRKIAALYSDEENIMNYQSVNVMVNSIKTKIKEYKWKQ